MYAYEIILSEHKINVLKLPEEIQKAIAEFKKIVHSLNLVKARKNAKVTESTLTKIKVFDSWITGELLSLVFDDEKIEIPLDVDPEKIQEELNKELNKNPEVNLVEDEKQKLGVIINSELEKLAESGQSEFVIDEIANQIPKTHKHIFASYEKNGKNGVITPKFSFLETSKGNFILSKK